MAKTTAKRKHGKGLPGRSRHQVASEGESPRAPQQDRGQRRVEEILDAAESVVAEVGWDAATTQAIGERAGASMGSLFHFFPTKEAMLVALARRYTRLMLEANERAMPPEAVSLPPEQLFERIIKAQVELAETTPAFSSTYDAVERRFGHDQGPCGELDEAIYERVRAFCAMRTPRLEGAGREASVRLMVGVVHRAMHDAQRMPHGQRESVYRAARDMLAGYLTDLDRRYGPAAAS